MSNKLTLSLSVPHQTIHPVCDEVPPEQKHCEQEWCPSLSQEEDAEPLQVKEEQELRTSRQGPPRHKYDTVVSPPFMKRECRKDSPPPSHLYRILTVENRAINTTGDIKTEPDVDEFGTSDPTCGSQSPLGVDPECCGAQRESVQGEETMWLEATIRHRKLKDRSCTFTQGLGMK